MKYKYLYILGLVTTAAALFSYFYLDIPVAAYFFPSKIIPRGRSSNPYPVWGGESGI
jgi:hypothetical protein